MPVFPSSSTVGLKLKALLRFPYRVIANSGIKAPIANGVITLGLDYPTLTPNAGIPDPSLFTIAALNTSTGEYEEIPLSDVPTTTTGDVRTPRGDAAYVILNTDRYVALTATLTAARAWTLPAASSVSGGTRIVIQDEAGGISSTNTITVGVTGADTINGASTFILNAARSGIEFRSDGTSKWSARLIGATELADASVPTAKLVDKAVTLAKQADVATGVIMGRSTAGTGSQEALSASTARTVLGATAAGSAIFTAADVAAQRAALLLGGGSLSGFRNKLINGDGAINQRAVTAPTDDTYAWDRHNVLTQTAAVGSSTLTAPATGVGYMMRLTQTQASAQRMGVSQILEAAETYGLRGQSVTLGGKLRYSNAAAVRYAVLEWTGTADAPVSDVVNSWTNATYTAGQFFNSTTLNVLSVGTITPSAATITDWSVTATVGSSATNLIVFIWTEGTAAQNSTLDVRWYLVEGATTGESDPFGPRHIQQELALCQRYFYRAVNPTWRGTVSSATAAARCGGMHPVRMRASPTITLGSNLPMFDGAATTTATINTNFSSDSYAELDLTTPAVLTVGRPAMVYNDGGTKYADVSAEL